MLTFFLGLIIGIGFWLWQYTRFQHKLRYLLKAFSTDSGEISLPLVPRLRREIALQQQYQQDLQSQLQTWQQLIDVAPVGYLQVDEENQLLLCNQKARQLLSIERWEPGQIRLLLELVRSYELDQQIEQTRTRQQIEVQQWVFHPAYTDATALGKMRSLTLQASSLPLPQGQVAVFLENLQPEVELRLARDRAFSDLAHELRTPLTSLRLVLETLQSQIPSPMRRYVERLLPEVDRLINLVQTWLDLSHLEIDPNSQLDCKPVEVRSLIDSVWQTLEPLAQPQQITLTYSGLETVWLTADPSRLTQVFVNLLHNSIKYSPFQASIQIVIKLLPIAQDGSQKLQIQIIDSGPGFLESDLPYVFERLYRGSKSRSRPEKSSVSTGSGLGLAIVQQIVLAHGGSIKAMNHPETGGAWVIVELPNVMENFSN